MLQRILLTFLLAVAGSLSLVADSHDGVIPASRIIRPKNSSQVMQGNLLTIDGKIAFSRYTPLDGYKSAFKPFDSLPVAPPPPTSPYILPTGSKQPLSTTDIAKALDTLFEWGPARQRYASYFTMLPSALQIKEDVASNVLAIAPGVLFLYQPYPVSNQTVGIKVSQNNAVTGFTPFADPADAIFVRLDTFGNANVPIPVADLVEANFLNGLVARLILGQYERIQARSLDSINFTGGLALPTFPNAYGTPSSYNTSLTFSSAIAGLLQNNPVQPMGLYLGWKAGEELDSLAGDDAKYRQTVLNLLTHRFSTRQLGEMTAFSLNFMVGYIKCYRIQQIVTNQATQPNADQNVANILTNLSSDQGIIAAKSLLSGFHSLLMGEFYANSQSAASNKLQLLANDTDFINGFEDGSLAGADQIFLDAFRLAYGIGYKDGFRDGYAVGYAAGWRDGYANGYAVAWSQAQSVINALQADLNDANSRGSFWEAVGGVATAVGGIAAFL